jgi:hypothetical protein
VKSLLQYGTVMWHGKQHIPLLRHEQHCCQLFPLQWHRLLHIPKMLML